MVKPLKFGYEGEGPLIGRKTAYASYPEVSVGSVVSAAELRNIDSIYYVVDSNHADLVNDLRSTNLQGITALTLDFRVEFYRFFEGISFALRFIRCDEFTKISDIPIKTSAHSSNYIKMVCEDINDFQSYVTKANEIAEDGHTVLLMPDFLINCPRKLGAEMMAVFDLIHRRVRVMPPVHHVLEMD